MKITKTVYIFLTQWAWQDTADYEVYSFKIGDTDFRTFVCEQTVELDVPDQYDATAQKIAALNAEAEELTEKYLKDVEALRVKVSNLQALEYTA